MKCVILAAGIGKRIRPLTRDLPKCLLPVGNRPLLERTIRNLHAAGVKEIAVVTGYKSRSVRNFVRKRFPRRRISFIENSRYKTTNNAFSLSLCKDFVAGEQFLLLDSDILFGPDLLQYLFTRPRQPNRLAVRVQGPHDHEEIRVRINRWDHIVAISKEVPLRYTYGESVGIGIFSPTSALRLFEILAQRIQAGPGKREFYEVSFQRLIEEGHRIWAVDTSRYPSAEIDTREDLRYAQETILPLLNHGR